jgi:16S rRNA (adenine1518-N6/adenine1519-N6)-dimethyltransferase
MKLSEIKQILAEGDIRLTKSLGQNFLHDANQLRRIVETARLSRQDKVLEVGPGLGPLTELLVERAGEVLAIEKDARLAEVLRLRFDRTSGDSSGETHANPQRTDPDVQLPAQPGQPARLQLIHDDALEYLKREERDWSEWKLVANLPYSVASPILVELALAPRGPERMTATVQIEVARRLAAGPGDGDYGILTLLVGLNYEPQDWFRIPAACFFPEPDVDSACVCLARRERPLLTRELSKAFIKIVKRAFSQRRKMMLKLLRQDWSAEKLEQAFARLRLSPQARAEAASLEQFVGLTRLLQGEDVGP